jgi:Effector Associated Constant Component 1
VAREEAHDSDCGPAVSNEDVLIHADEQGSWGWAGFRLIPALGPETANHFADFDRSRREERAADAEAAWLAAQWGVHWSPQWGPGGAGRFELRYRNDPAAGDGLVRCACLCRVRAASARAAVDQARAYRGSLASGLPGHVRADPLTGAADVHGWLVPFEAPGPGDSQVELIKKLTWQRAVRQDLGRSLTVQVARLAARRVSWEPLLRRLGGLPFPAVLSIGFEPFARSSAFRTGLEQLAEQYAQLARPASGSAVYSATTLADPFTAKASQRYAQYAHQYDAPGFRIRISLVGEQELPGQLGTWLAAALGDIGPDGASASALVPLPHERELAWTNVATLGAGWLPDTYRGSLPDSELGPLERELLTLVDLAEIRSLIQLPISWPGHPELFAGLVQEPGLDQGLDQGLDRGFGSAQGANPAAAPRPDDLWQAAPEPTYEEQAAEELEEFEGLTYEEPAAAERTYEDLAYEDSPYEDLAYAEPVYEGLPYDGLTYESSPYEEPAYAGSVSEEPQYVEMPHVEPMSQALPAEQPLREESLSEAPAGEAALHEEPWVAPDPRVRADGPVPDQIGDPALRHKIGGLRSFRAVEAVAAEYVFTSAETGTSAQDDLCSLDRWLNDRAELDADVELRTRPPGPGEAGEQPEAVAALACAGPLARAYFAWLRERVRRRPVSMTVLDRHRDRALMVKVGNDGEADLLLPELKDFFSLKDSFRGEEDG